MKIERLPRFRGFCVDVKNLDEEIDEERLRKEFRPFGNVTSAKVMVEKGFGFVSFSSLEEVKKAIKEINGRFIGLSRSTWHWHGTNEIHFTCLHLNFHFSRAFFTCAFCFDAFSRN